MAQLPSKLQTWLRSVEEHNSPGRRERPSDDKRERKEDYAGSIREAGRSGYNDDCERSDWRTSTRGKDDTYQPSSKLIWRDREDRYDNDRNSNYCVHDRRNHLDERYGIKPWDRDRGPRSPRGIEYTQSPSGRSYRDEGSPAHEDTLDLISRSPCRQSGSPSFRARYSPPFRKSQFTSHRQRDTQRRRPQRDSSSTSARSDINRDLEFRQEKVRALDRDGRPNECADRQPIQKERSASSFDRLQRARSVSLQSLKIRSHSYGKKFADAELDNKPALQPPNVGSLHDEVQKDVGEGVFAHHMKEDKPSILATSVRENFQLETKLSVAQRRLPNVDADVPRGRRSGIETCIPVSILPENKPPTQEVITEWVRMEEWRKKVAELAHLRRTQVSLMAEFTKNQLAMRRAKHESSLATLDRKVTERRRQIAEIQLEQAQDGKLGIDYDGS